MKRATRGEVVLGKGTMMAAHISGSRRPLYIDLAWPGRLNTRACRLQGRRGTLIWVPDRPKAKRRAKR